MTWENISSDISCGDTDGFNISYIVQWRILDHFYVKEEVVCGFSAIISGLLPSVTYEFNVHSAMNKYQNNWVQYFFPGNTNVQPLSTNYSNETDIFPSPPFNLEYDIIPPMSINLKWNDSNNFEKYYSVCFYMYENNEVKDCDKIKHLTRFVKYI